jgi:hypothetical protein
MRLPPPKLPPANSLVANLFTFVGPRVPAGAYTVKLVKGDQTLTGEVRLVPDPRSTHSAADRALQQRTAMDLYRRLEDLTYVVDATIAARDGARQRSAALPAGDKLRRRLETLAGELEAFRKSLVAAGEGGMLSGEERLREKLGDLYGAVNGYEGRPTQSQIDYARVLGGELERAEARFEELRGQLAANGVRASTREEWQKEREKG